MSTSLPLILTAKPLAFKKAVLPEDIFAPLSNTPWSMWLDSCDAIHENAHYDILVWQPLITLVTFNEVTVIFDDKKNQLAESHEDPLVLLKQWQDKTLQSQQTDPNGLPFVGGAIGYFAYDLGRRFETMPEQAEADIAEPDMAVGIYSQAIIYDRKKQQYFLICPENMRSKLEVFILSLLYKESNHDDENTRFALKSTWHSNMTKSQYREKFAQVQQYLLSGDCYQINLAQRFIAEYQGNEFEAYCALRKANKAPFSAFIRLEESAILSISPERFLKLSQDKVQSKPIKGTMPRSNDPIKDRQNAETLAHSSKDRAENVMIVDLLRNDIAKVCRANTVNVPALFEIESFPAVHHLVSTVEGQLQKQYSATDLIRAAFPGGSITGAPKIRAMEIIDQLEPHRRSIYCGSIGYISNCGTMDTSITIRTLICKHNKNTHNTIYCWAGGGLVADSTVDAEYQETFDKVNQILPVLNALTPQETE